MRKAFFLAIALVLSLLESSCARSPATTSPAIAPSYHKMAQHPQVSSFTRVDIKGLFDVEFSADCHEPRVVLHGEALDLANVQTRVIGDTLQIRVGKGYPKHGEMQAEICAQYLNSFRYQGNGAITGHSLRSRILDLSVDNNGRTILHGPVVLRQLETNGSGYLQINEISSQNLRLNLKGSGRIELAGMVHLGMVEMSGSASLSLYWVKSNNLVIHQRGDSYLQLAGIVERLDMELWGKARFQGRYLRAQTVFAKTHDGSFAEIIALKRQHTLASDSSDIHFYKILEFKTDFMACSGAVLDLRDWNNPWMQEYTIYNK